MSPPLYQKAISVQRSTFTRCFASDSEPARVVVVLLKGKAAPILTPVKE
jgi:hypothetical protein